MSTKKSRKTMTSRERELLGKALLRLAARCDAAAADVRVILKQAEGAGAR